MRLPQETFLEVVRNAPLISIDLVLRDSSKRVLLGRRNNNPARGSWFVPGGVIYKGETIDQALRRVFETELGQPLEKETIRFMGVYEHFYDENFAGIPGISTHYVTLAYEIRVENVSGLHPDSQHESLRWMEIPALLSSEDVHENTKTYFT